MDPFGYNLYTYDTIIILKEILKHTKQYLENDVIKWIITKCFNGSKSNYYDILSMTGNFFYYCLFRTEETINYKTIRKWFLNNPLYIKSNDETIKMVILPMNKYENCSCRQYLNHLTYEKLYNKVREIENHEINYKFIIICDFFKEKLVCGTAVNRLK